MKTLYGTILVLVLSSCGNMKKHENPLIIDFNDRFDFGRLKAGDISRATDYVLSQADNIRDEIIAIDDKQRSFENTLLPIEVYSAPTNHFFSLLIPKPKLVLDGIDKSVLSRPIDSKSTLISLTGNSMSVFGLITTDANVLLFLELRL